MTYPQMLTAETVRSLGIERASVEGLMATSSRASDADLRRLLDDEVGRSRVRSLRLAGACEAKGWPVPKEEMRSLEGVRWDTREALSEGEPGPVLDVALASLARKLAQVGAVSYHTALALAPNDPDLSPALSSGAREWRSLDGELAQLLSNRLAPAAREDGGRDPHKTRA